MNQQTDFDFEVLIHDDCSPDGTADIIREYAERYPDIIRPMYETENQYSQGKPIGTQVWNLPRARGKYIAICEGDDYWTDPLKLQKQVDFLEANPEYGMCYTDFDVKNEVSGQYTRAVFRNKVRGFKAEYDSPEEFIANQAYMCPPSWLFRREVFPEDMIGSCDGTFVMFTHFLCVTKVKYLDFPSSVYRIVAESASHSANFDKMYSRMCNILETQMKLIDRYHLKPEAKQQCRENFYRLYLVDLIINRKEEDIREARKIIRDKTARERILFTLHTMHLTWLLPTVHRMLPSRL